MATPHDTTQNTPFSADYPWQAAFLAALRACGDVARACKAARVDRRWVYRVRDECDDFRTQWRDARDLYAADLHDEALRRAVDGVPEPILYRGKPIHVWADADGNIVAEGTPGAVWKPYLQRRYSDRLLMKLLASALPEEYGARRRPARRGPAPEASASAQAAADARGMTDAQIEAALERLTGGVLDDGSA